MARLNRLPWLVAGALALVALPAHGQGQYGYPRLPAIPPIAQMFLEGYHLPPVTTGPSFPTWSPDGSRLAFSMEGSIWTISSNGGTATQVTSGRTYDLQPQWSPDGRSILYAGDLGGRIELFVLDLPSGRSHQMTRLGGVNIDARWSPDGSRIVFVSSARIDSYNIWTVGADGRSPVPLTTDTFRNLDPVYSPDGRSILFISTRESLRGSGWLWQMPAEGGPPRLIHAEDTMYQARPVFSPDGSRIAYASYRRGSYAICLLPSSGGEPIPITYGPAEAFTPAWSPDGSRIAYTDNSDGGRLALWVTGANGGQPRRVTIAERRYAHPVGRIAVTIENPDGDTAARIYVSASNGKSYFPLDTFRRIAPATADHYAHIENRLTVTVPTGPATIEATKGFEYAPVRAVVDVREGETATVTLRLRRLVDLPADGWYGGDNHVHMNYGGMMAIAPSHLAMMQRAEDLHVLNSLICNRDTRIFDLRYFEGRLHSLSMPGRLLYFNQEYRPNFYGHMGLLRLKRLVWPFYNGYRGTALHSPFPTNADALDMAHAAGGVGGAWHPFNYPEDPSESDYAGARELPVDVALGKTDFMELASLWSVESTNASVWYKLLNAGFRVPPSAGTDAFPNIHRNPAVGAVRVYVKAGRELTYDGWIDALLAGRSFVTSGPLIRFTVDGRDAGDTLRLPPSVRTVAVRARLDSIVPMQAVTIIRNGRVAARVDLTASETTGVEIAREIQVPESSWLALRVEGDGQPHHLLMESAVFAHTAPVYVVRGDEPIQSAESARYFIRWIDRSLELLEAETGWNTQAEREHAIEIFRLGRKVYEQMLATAGRR